MSACRRTGSGHIDRGKVGRKTVKNWSKIIMSTSGDGTRRKEFRKHLQRRWIFICVLAHGPDALEVREMLKLRVAYRAPDQCTVFTGLCIVLIIHQ